MKVEHVAYNVPDALSMGRWYVEHLGMTVIRRTVDEPWAHFLADDSGTFMFEIYTNKDVPIPDYNKIPPPNLHFAFSSDDPDADFLRLKLAGAAPVGEVETMPNGDVMAMLRDPWGVPLQLVKRADPMI